MTEVSVITAVYNSARVIERNIRCVATQSLAPAEHIIVDDGSRDGTVGIVLGLQREFPHLQLIRQKNGGAGAARNAAIAAARSRYVAFLDCDDYWSEHKLKAQIEFMAEYRVAFSFGDYDDVDARTGTILRQHRSPKHVTYSDLLRGCPIGCLTAAFDQTMLGKRYMPNVRRGQDWGLWLALTRDGTVARRYPGRYAIYSHRNGSLSSGKLKKAVDIYSIYREQENVGPVRTVFYMIPHVRGALAKRIWRSRRKHRSAPRIEGLSPLAAPGDE